MKFYLPNVDNADEIERIYSAIRKFVSEQTSYSFDERRVRTLVYIHSGTKYFAEIGKILGFNDETVITILHSDNLYYICTPHRGVMQNEPIYVGEDEVLSYTDFDK